jgi:hypothetical protein
MRDDYKVLETVLILELPHERRPERSAPIIHVCAGLPIRKTVIERAKEFPEPQTIRFVIDIFER